MGLKFPPEWRINPPKSTSDCTEIDRNTINDFMKLIRQTASQGTPKLYFEHFKSYYCRSNGESFYPSSSESWAETDLDTQMEIASSNPPIFIEAFYNACEALNLKNDGTYAPDTKIINKVLTENNVEFYIEFSDPPELRLRDNEAVLVEEPEMAPSLPSQAMEILQKSLKRSDELLREGRGREAIQESLWLLETMSTAFNGIETETGTIEGKYFNDIVKELKRSNKGKTLNMVLGWVQGLHGYLSSPSGGGVRHGLDLKLGIDLNNNDARLFCNLIRSYMFYLLSEHKRLCLDFASF